MASGGYREGAGRKPKHRTHTVSIRLSDDTYKLWQSIQNKTEWVDYMLRVHYLISLNYKK